MERVKSFLKDILVGVRTIVKGVIVYEVWVVLFGFYGIDGGMALAMVMLPLVIR